MFKIVYINDSIVGGTRLYAKKIATVDRKGKYTLYCDYKNKLWLHIIYNDKEYLFPFKSCDFGDKYIEYIEKYISGLLFN